jgi:hypothetical protein
MQPIAHALSVFIPGYGYWQVYRHFALIGGGLERVGVKTRVDPLSAAIGVVVWSVTFLHYSADPIFVALDAIELLAATAVVVYGQRASTSTGARGPDPRPRSACSRRTGSRLASPPPTSSVGSSRT